MIISASRRTDIPALYPQWFLNCIRAGRFISINPWNSRQIKCVDVDPEKIDCIVFWTKDPQNMISGLKELDNTGYKYYFQFTLNAYGIEIEPGLRPKPLIIETFSELADRMGKDRLVWRYDPIILNEITDIKWHDENFAMLCDRIAGLIDTCVISFFDPYPKLKSKLLKKSSNEEMLQLCSMISKTADRYGISLKACCEELDMSRFGIERAACIDIRRIEKICKHPLKEIKDPNQRKGCGCARSIDIGRYGTCIHGCIYCYANFDHKAAMKRFTSHDPSNGSL
jgi:hypothetical protein